jgi:hypothetical protein
VKTQPSKRGSCASRACQKRSEPVSMGTTWHSHRRVSSGNRTSPIRPGLLETTYKDIRAKATTAHVIVLGYPKLFTKEGKTCNVNFLTSGNEKKMNESAEKLDAVIKARAEAMKFTFVNPTSAFEAHEVCASEEWLNGQSDPLSENYHPNTKGQEEFQKLIEPAI